MSGGELILYTAENGSAAIHLRAEGGTVWLTQLEMATLFDTSKQNVSLHSKSILEEGGRVRKLDVTIAKNYQSHDEIESLDRIVVMYLDYVEDQAHRRRTLTMRDWEEKLDAFL